MPIRDFAKRAGRGLAVAAVALAAVCLTAPNAAQARIDTGAAVGIGLGSFALGTALGAGAAAPYNPYYAPGYAYPAPAPAPGYYPGSYYPPRSCWDPYRRYYYAC